MNKAQNDAHSCGFCHDCGATIEPLEIQPMNRCPGCHASVRLEYLRAELRAERMSYGELIELQNLAEHIDPGDVELLEAAGVPEFPEEEHTLSELEPDVEIPRLVRSHCTMIEHLRAEPDHPDAWTCLCGNTSHSAGFYPCRDDGTIVEPVIGGDWGGVLYVCTDCGRIFNMHTLAVVGLFDDGANSAEGW